MKAKPEIRRQMRARRQQLTPAQQHLAAAKLALRLQRQPCFQRAKAIAGYLPQDGEIDPRILLRSALRQGKQLYLPTLQGTTLVFVRYRPGLTPLQQNRFDIPEPRRLHSAIIPAHSLDLVLLPLVAFDSRGRRLGMGGGFYDRTFAWKLRQKRGVKPLLIGLAHHLQLCTGLPDDHWDIPLAAVASDRGLLHTAKGRSVATIINRR